MCCGRLLHGNQAAAWSWTTSESIMPRNAEPTWDSGRVKDLLSSAGGRAVSDLRVTPRP